ncbi:hypothetical protein ABIA07_001855 [Bradyrhizobium yuanmingense]
MPPQASPVRIPSAGEPVLWITVPARQADSATLAPTERSRPAVSTTSVRPEAMKKVRLACLSTLRMLPRLRKESLSTASTAQIRKAASRR